VTERSVPALIADEAAIGGMFTPTRSTAVFLVATDAMTDLATSAVVLAGARVVARVDWSAPFTGFDCPDPHPVVVVETQGVAEDLLAETLPRIDAAAAAAGLQLVVTLDPESIDVAAGAVLRPDVQLLCQPTTVERVAALVLAGQAAVGTHDLGSTWRENEAERLQRLNEEVARIAEVLARLTHQGASEPLSSAHYAQDRASVFGHEHAPAAISAGDVRRVIRARRLRDTFFSAGLIEDPGWDMLLDLFAAELESTQVSVSSLCIAAAVAPTTALRWIGRMSDAGLFERRPDPADRRRAFMALTPRASQAMSAYLGSLQRAGLSLVKLASGPCGAMPARASVCSRQGRLAQLVERLVYTE
jgi:DNA-binding MarR family transcriptional regulator